LSVTLLGQATPPAGDSSALRVAAIQPGLTANQEEKTRELVEQTREAAAQGAQLIVWPEGALNFDPRLRADLFEPLAKETGAYLALGSFFRSSQGVRNESTIVAPDGTFVGVYGKDHPVVWLGETSISGGNYPTYSTPLGTIGTMICYDLNFTDTARKMAGNGAQVIAVNSNDWEALASSQYTNLVMRAVENRVALVKADTMYDSAVIDAAGRVVARHVSVSPSAALLMASISPGTADAPLIRLGDWVGWLCIAGTFAFAALGIVSSRQAERPAELQPADHTRDRSQATNRAQAGEQ
jgi:apolipoprotein N-acyltransferase